MHYSPSQKHAIFCIRRRYLRQLALISCRRQQLLQQLQAAPGALSTGIADLASNHLTVDNFTQQLQELLAEEHTAYMMYLRKVGHEVSKVDNVSAQFVIAMASHELRSETLVCCIMSKCEQAMLPLCCISELCCYACVDCNCHLRGVLQSMHGVLA